MADEDRGFSLIKLDGFAKPATVLIEKISDAVGGVFKPFQIRRVAKAEAEANWIRAESQIDVTDLHRRAMRRFFEEEAKRQSNIEEIAMKALPLLEESSAPDKMSDDWITNFFEKCRIVSDQDMQQIWSRILAGEANQPGTFSKRTVNLLGDFDKRDAVSLTSLCGFVWSIPNWQGPFIFNADDPIFVRNNINSAEIKHLESIGLLSHSELVDWYIRQSSNPVQATYFGRILELTLPSRVRPFSRFSRRVPTELPTRKLPCSAPMPAAPSPHQAQPPASSRYRQTQFCA